MRARNDELGAMAPVVIGWDMNSRRNFTVLRF
jgi:hypothetical protein